MAGHYAESIALPQNSQMPFISLNIVGDGEKTFFTPYTTVKAGNLNIGITALSKKTKGKDRLLVDSWRAVLKKQLPLMKKKFDFIILLSELSTRRTWK
ncbi:hypothetical protein [Desulfotalea psychrophila]|uniref:hypothetical protein n=1 Tax=Desulfotalea psychrophila TaxID=84980 RepID=UPI00030ED219|nr:hypothetical protein [Desulfotalea psychrophila]